jgi:hypothetical protein
VTFDTSELLKSIQCRITQAPTWDSDSLIRARVLTDCTDIIPCYKRLSSVSDWWHVCATSFTDYVEHMFFFLFLSFHHDYSATPITTVGWLYTERLRTDVATTCSKRTTHKLKRAVFGFMLRVLRVNTQFAITRRYIEINIALRRRSSSK